MEDAVGPSWETCPLADTPPNRANRKVEEFDIWLRSSDGNGNRKVGLAGRNASTGTKVFADEALYRMLAEALRGSCHPRDTKLVFKDVTCRRPGNKRRCLKRSNAFFEWVLESDAGNGETGKSKFKRLRRGKRIPDDELSDKFGGF